ncbi:MAG: hypothetical protein SO067_06820 [Bacilli bacterium]|nr:hypothetical protein [Clostridium sp.]MDY3798807.1 hypothetical protein [Bacilli bacterium]
MDNIEETPIITLLLDEHENDLDLILSVLKDEELLLAFNGNHLIETYTDEGKSYIPLFTDINQIKNKFEYTRLDKVKLDVVIKDIFCLGKYYAIAINPYTHDFIMSKSIIDYYKKINN